MSHVIELAVRSGDFVSRGLGRVAQALVESLFVAATWIALLLVGIVVALQRGARSRSDASDPRTTSTSPGSTVHRAPLR